MYNENGLSTILFSWGICNDYKHSVDAKDRALFIMIYNNVKMLSSAILSAVI